jgi:O-antigen/teichoic acid export membrane protein
MEREVLAELLGVLVMIPIVQAAAARHAGLEALSAAFVASRIVFLLAAAAMGRGVTVNFRGVSLRDIRWALKASAPLGLVGLLVSVYAAMDLVVLEKLVGVLAVGQFSVAMRFIGPVITTVQALVVALFPLLASSWRNGRDDFRNMLRTATDLAMLAGAAGFCLFQCGAPALVRVMGGGTREAILVLLILSWSIFPRAVVTAISSAFVISGRLPQLLWLTAVGVLTKGALLLLLVPAYGAIGAAYAFVIAEIATGLIPMVILGSRLVGFPVNLGGLARIALATALVIGLCVVTGTSGTGTGVLLACLLFPVLAVALGAFSMEKLRRLSAGVGRLQHAAVQAGPRHAGPVGAVAPEAGEGLV